MALKLRVGIPRKDSREEDGLYKIKKSREEDLSPPPPDRFISPPLKLVKVQVKILRPDEGTSVARVVVQSRDQTPLSPERRSREFKFVPVRPFLSFLGTIPPILLSTHEWIREQTRKINLSLPTSSFLPGIGGGIFPRILVQEVQMLSLFRAKMEQSSPPRKLLQDGLLEYESFMTSGREPMDLSIEAQFMWRTHLLHPHNYEKSCGKFFGKVIYPPKFLSLEKTLEFKDRDFLCLKSEFNSETGDRSPYSSEFSGGEALLRKAEKQVKFIDRLLDRREIYQCDWYLERIVAAFINFLWQVKQYPSQSFHPSLDVDFVWHTYMLFSKNYFLETQAFFGYVLDHITDEEAIKQLAVEEAAVPNMCRVHLFHKDFTKLGFMAMKMIYSALFDASFTGNTRGENVKVHVPLILEYLGDERPQSFCDHLLAFLQSPGVMQKDHTFVGQGRRYFVTYDQFLEKWIISSGGREACFSPELGGYYAVNDLFQRLNLQLKQGTYYKLVWVPSGPRIIYTDAKPPAYNNNIVDCRCCSPEFYTVGLTPAEKRKLCEELLEEEEEDDHHSGSYGITDNSLELFL